MNVHATYYTAWFLHSGLFKYFVCITNVLVKGRTRLVRICGSLYQAKYIDVLKNFVLPFKKNYHSSHVSFIQ